MSASHPDRKENPPPQPDASVPDPGGPPIATTGIRLGDVMFQFGSTLLAGVAGLVTLSVTMTPCVGATRSSRLQREERQRAVEMAVAQFESKQVSAQEQGLDP